MRPTTAWRASHSVRPEAVRAPDREWIVERPRIPIRQAQTVAFVPGFPDYGETAFTDCNAVTEAADGNVAGGSAQRARLIRMNLWDGPDPTGICFSGNAPWASCSSRGASVTMSCR